MNSTHQAAGMTAHLERIYTFMHARGYAVFTITPTALAYELEHPRLTIEEEITAAWGIFDQGAQEAYHD